MVELTIPIASLFDAISEEEKHSFLPNQEFFQKTNLKILNPRNQFIDINGLITKRSKILKFKFDDEASIEVADTHLFIQNGIPTYASDLCLGDTIDAIDDFKKIVSIEFLDEDLVYDMEVNSGDHLYVTSNGLIHHNTLLTAALLKYANDFDMRTITVVPSSSLLKQTYDYIAAFDIEVGYYGGGVKETDKKNIVATWQSLQKDPTFIRTFEFIIWDECHTCKAYVAQQIMSQARNSLFRLGLTGTIPKDPLDKANLTAAFGPVIYEVTANQLQQRNILSQIDIHVFRLCYAKEIRYSFIDYKEEADFLQDNDQFHSFMAALTSSISGNTLILMKNIEPAEQLSKLLKCDFISSKLNLDKRKKEFEKFKHGANHIAVGTYSLLSTGIDIVHINNLVLAPSPGKSFTTVIQSIGRGLRRKEGQKEHVTVIDLTSNLKYDKKHIDVRKKYYKDAKYPFAEEKIDFSGE